MKRGLFIVMLVVLFALVLGVTNSFIGKVVVDIPGTAGDGGDPEEINGGGGCSSDADCSGGKSCFLPCGVCGYSGCNYVACHNGNQDACCEVGLMCNEYDHCTCVGGGGGSCFVAGTKILMSDGSEKDIEDVQVGDYVVGREGKAEVFEIESPVREGYYLVSFEEGHKLGVTDEHPLYARNSEKESWSSIIPEKTELDSGMSVLDLNEMIEVKTLDGWIEIEDIEYVGGEIRTYNLKSVEGNTFFANGFLAHNKEEEAIPTEGGGCLDCYYACGCCDCPGCEWCCESCGVC